MLPRNLRVLMASMAIIRQTAFSNTIIKVQEVSSYKQQPIKELNVAGFIIFYNYVIKRLLYKIRRIKI